MKREEMGRNQKKLDDTERNRKKQEETGRNRKKQEEMGEMVAKICGMVPKMRRPRFFTVSLFVEI